MTRRAAISIGVNRVAAGLSPLTAAASGAREVAAWLERNEYEVETITDEVGPVTRSQIYQAVQRRVSQGTIECLVIYFAGHGFLRGPVDEYWLLSNAPTDAAEAVSLTLSINMARYQGIPQIMIISDACRMAARTTVQTGVTGASIFPNLQPTPQSAEIDVYYATRPGDPAHERKASEAKKAHGLFTAALLDAHQGAPPEALIQVEGRDCVKSRWLKQVLQAKVDERAQAVSLDLTQRPDIQLQIYDGYIAENEALIVDCQPPAIVVDDQAKVAPRKISKRRMSRSGGFLTHLAPSVV